MKIDTRKSTGKSKTGRLLGGLTAAEFLRDYWQRKPLLVRGAMAGFIEPLDKREVLDLTMRDDAESRLIFRAGNKWSLVQGPLSRRDLAAARAGLGLEHLPNLDLGLAGHRVGAARGSRGNSVSSSRQIHHLYLLA